MIVGVIGAVLPVPLGWDEYNPRRARYKPTSATKLYSSRRAHLVTIIEQTKIYAIGEKAVTKQIEKKRGRRKKEKEQRQRQTEGEGEEEAFQIVNDDRIADVLTLRHLIHILTESLGIIERKIAEIEKLQSEEGDSKLKARRLKRRHDCLYQIALAPLSLWRKELQRRLRVGDYMHRRQGRGRFQALGDARDIPHMPLLRGIGDGEGNLWWRTMELVRLARPLINRKAYFSQWKRRKA